MLHMNLSVAALAGSGAATSIEDVMNNGMSLSDRLLYGLRMTAVGMLTVFAVLGIIYLVMLIFRAVFYHPAPKAPEPAAPIASAPAPAPAPAAAKKPAPAPAAPAAPAQNDDAIVAVLTAAVAAILADEAAANGTEALPFRVVSFRRTGNAKGRGWNAKV